MKLETPDQRRGDAEAHAVETAVSLADLFPTLCGLAGVDVPDDLDGVYRMARRDEYKYVRFGDGEELFFDLGADSGELDPLAEPDGEAAEALVSLRSHVESTMDFASATEERERDETRKTENRLAVHAGSGNLYHVPDGRIVEADTPLYQPHVVTRDPDAAFADWPDGE